MKKRELCISTESDFEVVFLLPDVEKRENPVCHFVTPLDGNIDMDVHRPAEVKLWKNVMAWCKNSNSDILLFLFTKIIP